MMLPPRLSLGPFKVDQTGMLSPSMPDSFPRFGVRWRGRLLSTGMRQCNATDPNHGVLELSMCVGRVPSSAGPDAPQRRGMLALARALPRLVPSNWQWRLRADHTMVLECNLLIDLPVSAVSLVGELTAFLLQLDPFLQELDADLSHLGEVIH